MSVNTRMWRGGFIEVRMKEQKNENSGWLVGWAAGRLVGWAAGLLVGWSAGLLGGWGAGLLVGWSAGLLVCWSAGWLVGWLASSPAVQTARSELLGQDFQSLTGGLMAPDNG